MPAVAAAPAAAKAASRARTAPADWFGGDYDVGFFEAGGCWLKIECFRVQGRRICVVVGIICPTFSTGED